MLLDQYQWSRNPRGMHNTPTNAQIDHSRYLRAHFGWIKLVVTDDRFVGDAVALLAAGITPIVRIWRPQFGASGFDEDLRAIMQAYLSAGVKWFEFYNEPNQQVEWPEGTTLDWRSTDQIIRPLMDNWLLWAEYIVSQGAYPGFIPLSESLQDNLGATLWLDAFLNYLAQYQRDRFINVITNGLYAATHPYILNHYYQEIPGALTTPRQPQDQRAGESGWHFEYPYDPLSQQSEPGLTVASGPAWKPNGDPVGLVAMGQLFNERIVALFGAQVVPVVGTEGGIWPFPNPGQTIQPDPRYPPITHESHAEATLAMFEWIATTAPPWFFGVCLWKEDEYYDVVHALAIDRLEQTAPITKSVPPMGPATVFEPDAAPVEPEGPGPVHGEPDFHMIILPPELDTSWFFETAQPYWNRFRPIVASSDSSVINEIPYAKSLAVTVIAPPEQAASIRDVIRERYPNVRIDVIIAQDDMESVRAELNRRVEENRRFG